MSLSLDPATGASCRDQLGSADQQLRDDCQQHLDFWFETNDRRSLKQLRRTPQGEHYNLDDLKLVDELLRGAWTT